jgi:hypothetical protein
MQGLSGHRGVRQVTRHILTAALMGALTAALALAGCDKAKERRLPPDAFAALPPEATSSTPIDGLSHGLARRRELAGFSLDHAGAAQDPLNKRPAVTPAGRPILLDGFGFDPVAKAPAMGVDVVVDGTAYGTTYGSARPDVASYTKTPGLVKVGFAATLPAGALAPGPHIAVVRVVAADGKSYYEGVAIPFGVQ